MGNEASTRKTIRAKEAREKEKRALDLKNLGLSYQEVAEAMGYRNAATSKRLVDRALKRIPFDGAQEFRQRQLVMYDALLRTQTATALQPVPAVPSVDKDGKELDELTRLSLFDARARSLQARQQAHDNVLRIMAAQARLTGIEVQKTELSGPDGGPLNVTGSGIRIFLPAEEKEPGE